MKYIKLYGLTDICLLSTLQKLNTSIFSTLNNFMSELYIERYEKNFTGIHILNN